MMQVPSFHEAITRLKRQPDVVAIILENDLYHSIPSPTADLFFQLCNKVIALDSLNNRTTEKADILIPAATFAEADGTLVNYEGRAQRFFQVFMPDNPFIKESWRWLGEMQLIKNGISDGKNIYLDKFDEQLEAAMPQFKGLTKAAPSHNFTIHGERIPRQPHRYSGRTAMRAHLQVSEPKPLQDNDSPLTFTMEGFKGYPPSPLVPFFWSPGWNSAQAVLKYQEEPNGSLRGGDPGVRLLNSKGEVKSSLFKDMPEAFRTRQGKWLMLPQYHALGSSELSSYTKALETLSPKPFASISTHDAELLKLKEGDWIKLLVEGNEYTLPMKINRELCNGLLVVTAGLKDMPALNWGCWTRIEKIDEA
jgi:NADH-quinone oxidoreductase subunit G